MSVTQSSQVKERIVQITESENIELLKPYLYQLFNHVRITLRQDKEGYASMSLYHEFFKDWSYRVTIRYFLPNDKVTTVPVDLKLPLSDIEIIPNIKFYLEPGIEYWDSKYLNQVKIDMGYFFNFYLPMLITIKGYRIMPSDVREYISKKFVKAGEIFPNFIEVKDIQRLVQSVLILTKTK